jgi:DNA repair protein RadC
LARLPGRRGVCTSAMAVQFPDVAPPAARLYRASVSSRRPPRTHGSSRQTPRDTSGGAAGPTLAIRELPLADRPRERLQRLGAGQLTTPELLAILIGSGAPGYSALALGYEIMRRCGGSLRALGGRPVAELTAIPGVGPVRATVVHAALEMARRWSVETAGPRPAIRGPSDVAALLAPRVADLTVEELHVLILDSQHRMTRDVTVTRGLLNSSPVHAREVFREAIAESAAAVVLVHNHPSGDPTPSADDLRVTADLVAAGRVVDIPVFDHVIIGRRGYVSLAERRLLDTQLHGRTMDRS